MTALTHPREWTLAERIAGETKPRHWAANIIDAGMTYPGSIDGQSESRYEFWKKVGRNTFSGLIALRGRQSKPKYDKLYQQCEDEIRSGTELGYDDEDTIHHGVMAEINDWKLAHSDDLDRVVIDHVAGRLHQLVRSIGYSVGQISDKFWVGPDIDTVHRHLYGEVGQPISQTLQRSQLPPDHPWLNEIFDESMSGR